MTTFGYWDVRGVGQPLRYLLAYLNIEFTNKTYTGDAADWFNKDKQELGIPLPNLPYLIDEDIKLSESTAILIYLIKKYKRPDLIGQNADGSYSEKEIRFAQVLGAITDLRKALFSGIFSDTVKFEDVKEDLFKNQLSGHLKKLLNYLGDKEYLLETLTYADFFFYEMIAYMKHYYPTIEVPTEYIQRIENIPRLKEYLVSPQCIKAF